jgi:opacity protein-like surface antigen
MKKLITLIFLGSPIGWGLSLAPSAESGKGASLGVSVGGFPLGGANGLRYGGEIGFKITDRLGVLCEFAYGQLKQHYESSSSYGYSSSDNFTYSSTPVSVTLLLSAPLGKGFSTYAGIGVGYYSIILEEERNFHYTWGEDSSKSETEKIDGLAPHFSLGAETQIFKRIAVFGEVRHFVGKTKFEKTEQDGLFTYNYKNDVFFGGTEVRVGLRFYFKG